MKDHPALFAILIAFLRFHQGFAVTLSVSGTFFVQMKRIQAFSAMISTAASKFWISFLAVFTDEFFVYYNELFHSLNYSILSKNVLKC